MGSGGQCFTVGKDKVNRRNRILILNQHRVLESMETHLRKHGYYVSSHSVGHALKELNVEIGKEDFDLILINATPPYPVLFEFLFHLRKAHSSVCVLLCGEAVEADQMGSFLKAGVFDFIKKPFLMEHLEKTIQQGLKNREKLLEILELSDRLEEANRSLGEDRDQLQKWNEHLSRLHAFTQTLGESLQIEEVIQSLTVNLKMIVSYDVASIFLMKTEVLSVTPNGCDDMVSVEQIREQTRRDGSHLSATRQFPSGVFVQKKGTEITIPLMMASEKIGILKLSRLTGDVFDEYESRILSMVSNPVTLAIRNAETYQQMRDLAVKDELTAILNRRAFGTILEREFKRAERYTIPLSLILVDIDYFKEINDCYGHLAGDSVLFQLAAVLRKSIRDIDILFRYAGDEFVILLPGTGHEEVMVAARRIREMVNGYPFSHHGMTHQVTISMGVAHGPIPGVTTTERFFEMADQALYSAKRKGRNRIEVPIGISDMDGSVLTHETRRRG